MQADSNGRRGDRRGRRSVSGTARGRPAKSRAAYACRVTYDGLRSLVAGLPDGDGLLRVSPGYAVKARPTAPGAEAAGTDLETLDAGVIAQRGQLRTARVQSATAQRPGHRAPRPPSAPQRFYVVPVDALRA
jgi:hypothetical protein